jgi:flagellar basal-body rod protein FlgC
MVVLDALGIAISGLQAQTVKMNSTANNIANTGSEGYKPTRVNLSENAQHGVSAHIEKTLSVFNSTQYTGNNAFQINLAKEMIDMIETKTMYQANMTTLDSCEKTVGKLLDALG